MEHSTKKVKSMPKSPDEIPCEEVRRASALCQDVQRIVDDHACLFHGGNVVVPPGFVLGNLVSAPDRTGFMYQGTEVPSLLCMCVCIRRIDPRSQLPAGVCPQPIRGLDQAALAALLPKGHEFVVVAAAPAEAIPAFTGVRLTLMPSDEFLRRCGSVYKSKPRDDWTLSDICAEVVASLTGDFVSLPEIVLFTSERVLNLKLGVEKFLLTSAFCFFLCGYPVLKHSDLRSPRRQTRPIPVLSPFFHARGSSRPLTPASAMLECVLSLAGAGWRRVTPAGKMGAVYLAFCFKCLRTLSRDAVRVAVGRFILQTRHAALLAMLRGPPPADPDCDLHEACEAVRLSLVVDDGALDRHDCPSRFLHFLGKDPLMARATPWSWPGLARRFHGDFDALIAKHEGYALIAHAARPELSAQQLCDRVQTPAVPDTPRAAPCDATLAALMHIVGSYLHVRWRATTGVDHAPLFRDLSAYLAALRDPDLRTFLSPHAWAFYAQNPGFLMPLAEHFLSPDSELVPSSWVFFEELLRDVKRTPAPPRASEPEGLNGSLLGRQTRSRRG
jgi:hypothetical protein